MGIIWGLKYLRQSDQTSKIVGSIAIGLTLIILIMLAATSITLINTVNSSVNSQLQNMQGF